MRPQSIEELASLIDGREAQMIVARAIVAAGAEGPDWDSETIEHVLEPFLPLVQRLVKGNGIPHPFNSWREDDCGYYRGLM